MLTNVSYQNQPEDSLAAARVVISGASRGIGLAIARSLARRGARIALLAKTTEPHPRLPGTLYTAAKEIEDEGGEALPLVTDVRDEQAVRSAIDQTVDRFGGIDICINNASAISLTATPETDLKRFDLMFAVNVRGTFLLSKTCLPHLARGTNPHILNISPPLDMATRWFAPHVAYSISKFGMSQCVLGMAGEFAPLGVAVNALWPHSIIATAAITNVVADASALSHCRDPDVVADAACVVLARNSRRFTGNFCIDDLVLAEAGVSDFSRYRVEPGEALWRDFFVPADTREVEPMTDAPSLG